MRIVWFARNNSSWRLQHLSAVTARKCSTSVTHIDKLVIANRGEIACRIIRTARKLGIQTVAVYSDADKSSLHVQMADEAYRIGPPAADKSYLKQQVILDVAKAASAQAIHPGYGFLSENSEFADRCESQGIIFVGPPSSAIRDMGIKSTSKQIMSAANVPVIEGYHGADQSAETLEKEAEKIGYPVMIKAVRGGGGKGMRIAMNAGEFKGQLESAKLEAMKAVGDNIMLIEKFVEKPRHVEVQVFGDKLGNYVYLFERDCSVQRRHQKIIEEAPAPGLSPQTRQAIGKAAVRAAQAVHYVGAGTVEFIMDPQQKFFFMEMNTRLQVEHPVTEMVTGTDLVEWQLRAAAGLPLPLTQDELCLRGHAFEARIYAENPKEEFMPGAGPLKYLVTPDSSDDVRVETGVRQGDEVSVYYDPMIAKLVVWGPDRRSALRKLNSCLSQYNIAGLSTNISFLRKLAMHPSFQAGEVHTGFIPQHHAQLFPATQLSTPDLATATMALLGLEQQATSAGSLQSQDPFSPFHISSGKRLNHLAIRSLTLQHGRTDYNLEVQYSGTGKVKVCRGTEQTEIEATLADSGNRKLLTYYINDTKGSANIATSGRTLYIYQQEEAHEIQLPEPKFVQEQQGSSGHMDAIAPMPGTVEKVNVQIGDEVQAGDALVVMIAMKMEYVIRAPKASRVIGVKFQPGDTVQKGSRLVELEETI